MRIIVAGMTAQYPVGGVAWDYLQYVVGLARLGHEVYYHEDTWSWPYDPVKCSRSADGAYSAEFIQRFFQRYAPELVGRWHYNHLHEQTYGMEPADFAEVARRADIFLNVSGASLIPTELSANCVKVFLDTDPGYNQIMLSEKLAWSENVERWCQQIAEHDRYFTYAENIGAPDCLVPDAGYRWETTRVPVVCDLWSDVARTEPAAQGSWTTVMTWNNFGGPLVYRGCEYYGKGHEFRRLLPVPQRLPYRFQVAVGGQDVPYAELEEHGWIAADAPQLTLTARDYQQLIAQSRGEISTAKHVYAAMRTGWFSCRSACYLAAGRPVVVQDTGFHSSIPTGSGLLAFSTLEEAIAAVSEIESDYRRHRDAARDVARHAFEAEGVLGRFLRDLGV